MKIPSQPILLRHLKAEIAAVLEDWEANLKIVFPIAQIKSAETTDAVIPAGHAMPSWFAQTRDCVSTQVVFPSVMTNSAETTDVEASAEFAALGHPANKMVNVGLALQIAATKCVGMMAAEAHVANVHLEALAVLKGNASAHQNALEKNAETTAVEDCVGRAPGANSAPHRTHAPHAWRIVSVSNAGMMAAGGLAANVLMVSAAACPENVEFANQTAQENTAETMDVEGFVEVALPGKYAATNFSAWQTMELVSPNASIKNAGSMAVRPSAGPVPRG